MSKHKRPQDFESVRGQVLQQLLKESDRGCVLIAAAMLDEALEFLLRQRMASEDATVKACVAPLFAGVGPLKSFWAKTQLARALGFIDSWVYDDLERIRTLRNLFAHTYEKADFGDARVVALTEHLVAVEEIAELGRFIRDIPLENSPAMRKERMRFMLVAARIAGHIHGIIAGYDQGRSEAAEAEGHTRQ